ncbi:phospholipase D-like domain-containing protein [Nostoc sp.]|uniref:phospholipase D-like domain-containing protein n=1 Tax=Nostoc sp. TaxID=1180 RepID=UPI002FFA3686
MSTNKLIYGRDGSRNILMEALTTVQSRLIIVCPWITNEGIEDVTPIFEKLLKDKVKISIGWGNQKDISKVDYGDYPETETLRVRLMKYLGWKYLGIYQLQRLEKLFPDLFELKLVGTHEKYLVCDNLFAFTGSHNILTSKGLYGDYEIGLRITESSIINELIEHFDECFSWEKDKWNLIYPN